MALFQTHLINRLPIFMCKTWALALIDYLSSSTGNKNRKVPVTETWDGAEICQRRGVKGKETRTISNFPAVL